MTFSILSGSIYILLQISFIFLFFSIIFFFTGAVLLLFSRNCLLLICDIDDFADLLDRGDLAEGRGLA